MRKLGLGTSLLLAFLVPAIASAQKKGLKDEDRRDLPAWVERVQANLKGSSCATKGSLSLDVTKSGTLSFTSCTSTDSSGTLYADFYTFVAQAGHTYEVTSNSSLAYIATIQDYSTGVVLASSGSCGSSQDLCDFTYTTPSSTTYLVGFGSYQTGGYTLKIEDKTLGPPPCGDATTLCLNAQRFTVSVIWSSDGGATLHAGTAIAMSGDTGYFWFFDSANVELVVKVLDGRAINGKFWVFYGSLSDVSYTITVTDTVTHAQRTYTNPQGHMASAADTSAF
jgi:hypothetical protein